MLVLKNIGTALRRKSMKSNAWMFTLIELIVVMAVIAILMSLLLPTLGKVRGTAKRSVCINNQKQIGTGMALYSDDHNDYATPPSYLAGGGFATPFWNEKIAGYLGETKFGYCYSPHAAKPVWICPGSYLIKNASWNGYGSTYVLNSAINYCGAGHYHGTTYHNGGLRRVDIRWPTKLLVFADAGMKGATNAIISTETKAFDTSMIINSGMGFWHDGRSIAAFLDGHVEDINPAMAAKLPSGSGTSYFGVFHIAIE